MRRHTTPFAVLTATLALASATASAQEMTVQNDSYVSGGSAVIVGDFAAGEQAGVRLVAPCDGNIVAVQIAWLASGGASPTVEQAIHIFADDGLGFPSPGTELQIIDSPYLSPGYLNEFRYLDDANSIPLSVPVTAGQAFYVTLEFYTATNIAGGTPSVIRDVDGCTSNANILYANPPGAWIDFCIYLGGDLVIRAVVDCVTPCPADLDSDNAVTVVDLLQLLGAWGAPGGDVNGDNNTDVTDLLALLGAWGPCP